MTTPRQLRRSTFRVFGGVCGGLAEYFGIDPTVVRIIWIALTILSMGIGGVILYLLAWIIMPAPLASGTEAPSSAPIGKAMVGVVLIGIGVILLLMMALPWGCYSPWHWSWHWPLATMRFGLPLILLIFGVILIALGLGSKSSTSTIDEIHTSPESGASQIEDKESERPPVRRLYRSLHNKKIAGICGGLGDYFNVDPTLIRILWILLVIFFLSGILIYLILWIVVPQEPIVVPPTTSTS